MTGKILIAVNILVSILVLSFLAWQHFAGSKTAYINTQKVYNEFELKKELETKLHGVKSSRQKILDSLQMNLKMMAATIKSKEAPEEEQINRFNLLREEFFAKEEEFHESNEALAQELTGQIWSQLNQYVGDYGGKFKYTYVFGTSGDGNLMYAETSQDITDAVIAYANERHHGEAK